LFPPAYSDDPLANDEYERLMHDDLLAERTASLDVFERTVDARKVNEEQLLAWMSSVNDIRLILGTRLDVTEEMYDLPIDDTTPTANKLRIYHYVGWLGEQMGRPLGPPPAPAGTERA